MEARSTNTALVVAFLTCFAAAAMGDEYEVEGVVTSTFFGYGPDNQEINRQSSTADFRVTVWDCQWRIVTVPRSPSFDYQQASFDGTNLYYITMMEAQIQRGRESGKKFPLDTNIAESMVFKNDTPNAHGYEMVGPVWIAYASSCGIQEATDGLRQLPFGVFTASGWDIGLHEPAYRKSQVTLLGKPPGLPMEAVYFEDGMRRPPLRPSRGRQAGYSPPYENGFTNTLYRVHSTTNLNSITVPLRSDFWTFMEKPHSAQSADDLFTRFHFQITATNLSKAAAPVGDLAKLPGKSTVTDGRFVREDATEGQLIAYMGDISFPAEHKVRQLGSYSAAVAKAAAEKLQLTTNPARPNVSNSALRWFLAITLGMVTIGTIVIAMRGRQKTEIQ